MDKHQILTDEELAMLQDLGDAEDMAAGQFLRGNLSLPLQSLLQRASPLTIEARIAGHQLRFPLHCTLAAEGHTELRIGVNVSALQLHRMSFVDEVRDARRLDVLAALVGEATRIVELVGGIRDPAQPTYRIPRHLSCNNAAPAQGGGQDDQETLHLSTATRVSETVRT